MTYKFAYFGTPIFSTFVLDELEQASFIPSLVVTTPDKPAGRGLELNQSAVKKWAVARDIPVLQPEKFDENAVATLRAAKYEFMVVAAYGKILPASVLSITKGKNLNVHPSLLPRYRGTSPVESQILADEKNVGVSVILMDEQMDHGPVVVKERIEIPEWPIARDTLNERLWHAGGKLLADSLPAWLSGTILPTPQNHTDATFTKKMDKEDGLVDLGADGRKNYLKYLAYEGWPGTYFFVQKDDKQVRVKITKASFVNGKFVIERVIPEGKREMAYADFARNR